MQRRVPRHVWGGVADQRAACVAWADHLDALADTLERWPSEAAIAEGIEHGVISDAAAVELRAELDPLDVLGEQVGDPLSLRDAWLEHPATRHERDRLPREHAYAEQWLQRWVDWVGSDRVEAATLERVQAYADHLAQAGYAYDTRRKAVRVLRRACAAARSHGLVDPLAGARIVRRTREERIRPRPQGWSLDAIALALVASERIADHRVGALVALMGGMGLRLSEASRALVCDLDRDRWVLAVGVREAKTAASVRALPVPPALRPYLDRASSGRGQGQAIVESRMRGRVGEPMRPESLGRWGAPRLSALTGSERRPAKALRASYASWCLVSGVPAACYESYLGHQVPEVAAITRCHYTTEAVVAWIARRGGRAMDRAIGRAVDRARRSERRVSQAVDRYLQGCQRPVDTPLRGTPDGTPRRKSLG